MKNEFFSILEDGKFYTAKENTESIVRKASNSFFASICFQKLVQLSGDKQLPFYVLRVLEIRLMWV